MSYSKRTNYTPEELLDAVIADLETDIRCAERDGLLDYAKEQRAVLKAMRRARKKDGMPEAG